MNNEIKVNKSNKSITFINNGIAYLQFGIADEILDLITNLQEEVKSANESITWWTNRFKAVEEENQKLKEKLRTTQEKWKKDKQWVECRTKEWLDYKSTIDKANEFIKEHTNNFAEYLDVYEAKELSNVLQGEDKR